MHHISLRLKSCREHATRTIGEKHYMESRGQVVIQRGAPASIGPLEKGIAKWKPVESLVLFTGLPLAEARKG